MAARVPYSGSSQGSDDRPETRPHFGAAARRDHPFLDTLTWGATRDAS